MSENYTEGPWRVDCLLVRAAENNEIICRIEPWREDTDAADARLIAASPDLLAALDICQRALAMMIELKSISATSPQCAWAAAVAAEAKARAMIASATGAKA